jgi:hypothetical protein
MSPKTIQNVLELIEAEVERRSTPLEFEMAYQVRVAIDRIRFAIKHTEQFCPASEQVRDAGLQLLDALERLENVERRLQEHSRRFSRIQRAGTGCTERIGNILGKGNHE